MTTEEIKSKVYGMFKNADCTEAEYSKVTIDYCQSATDEIMELFSALQKELAEKDAEIENLMKWKKEQLEVWGHVDAFVRPHCKLGESVSKKALELLKQLPVERQKSQRLIERINKAGNMEVDTPALYQLLISQIKLTLRKALNEYEQTQPVDAGKK